MAKKNALHSLFGGKARAESAERVRGILDDYIEFGVPNTVLQRILDAVKPPKALAGNVGGQGREQTVLTPQWLLDQLGPIALDPCTTPENPTQAGEFCALEMGCDGLEESWECEGGLVYVNPPFDQLEKWLYKAWVEAWARDVKILMLCPIRTNRTWWCRYAATSEEVATFRPFKFVGHTSAFPAPLCMMAWNCRVPDLLTDHTPRHGRRPLITGYYKRAT